jgi:Domain of unknown function (DUF5925)/ATPase family associated with various cellular activities (AAA)
VEKEMKEEIDPIAGIPCVISPDTYGADDALARTMEVMFISGQYPHWRSHQQRYVKQDSPLGPEYGNLIRTYSDGATRRRYIRLGLSDNRDEMHTGAGWVMKSKWSDHEATVTLDVVAVTEEIAEQVIKDTAERLIVRETPPGKIEMKFRYSGASGSAIRHRAVELVDWPDIRQNYAGVARPGLEYLVNHKPDDIHGRLFLLHGPTGTGKTTFLRSLIRSWGEWCTAEYIMDPDKMFSSASYLLSVTIAGGADAGDFGSEEEVEPEKWRLLILEDTGELLAGSAKEEMGQSLSRLLNTTDGLPGQGLKLMVAITSNDDLSHFHPAIVRPGRCLANIHVPELPHTEAVEWMGGAVLLPEKRDYTLAELITIREGRDVEHRGTENVGQFL